MSKYIMLCWKVQCAKEKNNRERREEAALGLGKVLFGLKCFWKTMMKN